MVRVALYTEGPTEWYVVYQLAKRGILSGATIEGFDDRNNIGRWLKSKNSLSNILSDEPEWERVLLLFDQESDPTPRETAKHIFETELNPVQDTDNVFAFAQNNQTFVLHVGTALSPDYSHRDFDGYIVNILNQMKEEAARIWFESQAREIRLPSYLREHRENNNIAYHLLHRIGSTGIPGLMRSNQWDILRSKGLLYSYITAIQVNKSHVWFAEKLVKSAPEDILRRTFSSLITAWDLLITGARHET